MVLESGAEGYTDIHAHILPAIDDGPQTWEEAMETVALAASRGTRRIVSTSHMMLPAGAYPNRRDTLLPLIAELQQRVAEAALPMQIYAGAEVYLTPDTPGHLRDGLLITYGDAGRYVLVEMPASEIPSYAEHALFELQLQGVTPIIAHPERNEGVRREPERLLPWVERGILCQLTLSSLRHQRFRPLAELLLQHGVIHFVATDTHGAARRPPTFNIYEQQLVDLVGEQQTHLLLHDHPRAVLAGKNIAVNAPVPLDQRRRSGGRRWWHVLTGRRR